MPAFVVGYHTGARRGEVFGLRKTQVDLADRKIRLYTGETKNDGGRFLPIYGDMVTVLEAQLATIPEYCPWLFHRKGQVILDFRASWDKAVASVGLPGLLFHGLRRSAVRNMVRAGIPEKVAMQISGHKTRSIFDRYNIVNERDLSDAAAKMERHLSSLGILSGAENVRRRVCFVDLGRDC